MYRDHDPLTPVTWARVTDLFEQAVGRPAAQREALLSVLRLHEPLVAAEVASLLASSTPISRASSTRARPTITCSTW